MNDDEFDDFLKTARAETPSPVSFNSGVWRRIESGEAATSRRGVWLESFMVALARPWGALAGVAATVALGLWLGNISLPAARDSKITYAESISPFAHIDRK